VKLLLSGLVDSTDNVRVFLGSAESSGGDALRFLA